jgi:hypothetical protein
MLTPIVLYVVIACLFLWSLYLKKQEINYHNRFKLSSDNENKFLADNIRKKRLLESQKEKIVLFLKEKKERDKFLLEEQYAYKRLKNDSAEQLTVAKKKCMSYESKCNHYKEENIVLSRQIKALDIENKKYSTEVRENLDKNKEISKKIIEDSENSISNLKNEIVVKEKYIKKLKSIKKISDKNLSLLQGELEKTKKKIKQYQYFYSVIEGRKQMLEERNSNWEKALRLLSSAILNDNIKSGESLSKLSLGELVAEALEFSHRGALVDDEYTYKKEVKTVTVSNENVIS